MKSNKVTLCKKDACITADGDHADLLVAIVSAVIIAVGAALVVKIIS